MEPPSRRRSGFSCLAYRRIITPPGRAMTQRATRGLYHRVSGGVAFQRSSAENPLSYNSRPHKRVSTPDTVEHTTPTAAWMEDHAPRVPGRSRIAISWAIPGPCGSRRGGGARSSPGTGSRAAPRWLVCAAACVSDSSCAGGAAAVNARIGMGRWSTGIGRGWGGRRAAALCRACGTKMYGTRSSGGGMKARGAKPEGVGAQSNGEEQGGGGWEGARRSGSRSTS
jgi:hypothetical protein